MVSVKFVCVLAMVALLAATTAQGCKCCKKSIHLYHHIDNGCAQSSPVSYLASTPTCYSAPSTSCYSAPSTSCCSTPVTVSSPVTTCGTSYSTTCGSNSGCDDDCGCQKKSCCC